MDALPIAMWFRLMLGEYITVDDVLLFTRGNLPDPNS